MATIDKISGTARVRIGSAECRRLRKQGMVPAILYGHGEDPEPVKLPADAVEHMARTSSKVLDLDIDGKIQKALVRDVQWDTFSTHVVHVDFVRVDANERIHAQIPVVFKGTSPGVVEGGILEQVMHSIDVECLAVQMPDNIVVKIGKLQIGDAVHVNEITDLPEGITLLSQEDLVVVHVLDPEKVGPSDEELETGEPAPEEPEVIGEKDESEDGEGDSEES